MDVIWVITGIVILGLTLADVFLTALNYDEAGFFAGRLAAWQWAITRRFTRRLARRWRPVVLRQVTGLQVMGTVLAWIGGVILGFGLIYFGSMQGKSFFYSGVNADLFGAIYFSAAQLATVGTSQITPNTDILRVLSIAETLTGVVLISLILTFLLGIYDVISNLRSLSSQFLSPGRGVGEPIASLKPYFPGGESRGLDAHLLGISDSFGSYTDGIRLHHAAYYFQSGRDTFALPYAVRMLAGTIGGLRWGLPSTNPVTQEPALQSLTVQFDQFVAYMHPLLKWTSVGVPGTVPATAFNKQVKAALSASKPPANRSARLNDSGDPWVARFIGVNREMAALVHEPTLVDLKEAYQRYTQWLPFAYTAEQFSTAVAHDLDYQPIYADTNDQAPVAVLAPAPELPVSDKAERGFRGFIGRRVTLIDPGYTRLFGALRALGAAVVTVAVLGVGLSALGLPTMPAAIFGGMIAMFTGAAAGGASSHNRRGLQKFASFFAVVPVLFAIVLNAIVPHEPIPSAIVLVLLAFLGIALGRFGRQLGGMGQLAFVSYYFTLLLHLQQKEFLLFGLAAIVGVLCSTLISLLPNRGAHARVVRGGVKAFEQRIVRSIDPLIDAVSAARWDPDLKRRVSNQLRQTHHTAAFLTAQLTGKDPDIGLTVEQAMALRIRVYDTELAAVNLAATSRLATGAGIPLEVRATLAGTLHAVQRHIAGYPTMPAWAGGAAVEPSATSGARAAEVLDSPEPQANWPASARRLHAAAVEMLRASDALYTTQASDIVGDQTDAAEEVTADAIVAGSAPLPEPKAIWKRATQSAISTGVALYLGSLVSTSYQYWAAIPAYQAIGGSDGETFVKGTQKIIGTVLGATVGFGVAIASGSHPAVLIPLLALCVFASSYFRSASSPLASFWQTMMFAQLYEFLGKLSTETIGVRILETVIGALVALVVSALVLPTRTRSIIAKQAAAVLRSVNAVVADSISRWKATSATSGTPQAAPAARTLARDEIAMTEQLRQLNVAAAPLRRASGALSPGGVEDQLTGMWALVYYARHLAAASERGDGASSQLSAEQWAALEQATNENFAALIATVDGPQPGVVHADIGIDDLGDADEPRATEEALRSLARVNQTMAMLAESAHSRRD